jgi:hypothetical protein
MARVRMEFVEATTVFDAAGRAVAELAPRLYDAGENAIVWRSQSDAGRKLCSGVYMIRVRVGNEFTSAKMLIVR